MSFKCDSKSITFKGVFLLKNQIENGTQPNSEEERDKWIRFLFFAYKKAKHFVTRETSFVNNSEIIEFESNLDYNIKLLADLLSDEDELKKEIDQMKGYLYFSPKTFGPNKQPRIRPKVTFPFKYQIMWAAVILRIGEWFDTNSKLKNVFSMRDESIRKELEWMVPWSFNGRIKRLTAKENSVIESNYIQYNSSRLYESHQMALRKFNTYKAKVTEELFKKNEKVYKAELDIQEFFPTLKKKYINEMLNKRLDELKKINCFQEKYFDPDKMKKIIKQLLNWDIEYPDTIEQDDPILKVLEEYYDLLTGNENAQENDSDVSNQDILTKIVGFLNDKLPLDLIASNFISNCVLNHFVDSKITAEEEYNFSLLRYTDDYMIISADQEAIKFAVDEIKKLLKNIELTYSPTKTLPTTIKDIEDKLKYLCEDKDWDKSHFESIKDWVKLEGSEITTEIKTKSLMVGINVEPEEISNKNASKDLFISNLSTTSDIKIQALSDDELKMYIDELLGYINAKGDLGELKEETLKIFAAWRLNSSHAELFQRNSYTLEDIKEVLNILEEMIKQYPTKLGFYDVYILLLLRLIESDEKALSQLKNFLKKIKTLMEESIQSNGKETTLYKFLSSCFPIIRIRILNLISNNWKRFDENTREKLRGIFQNVFLSWYANPNVKWDELYVLYSSFFILRIRLPLGICKDKKEYPEFLRQMKNVYNNYHFITIKNNEESNNSTMPELVMSGIDLLEKGLYWNKDKKELSFNEVDDIIYNALKSHLIQLDKPESSEEKLLIAHLKLTFAKIAPRKLEIEDWTSLTEYWSELIINEENEEQIDKKYKELIFEILDFLQKCIQCFFEKPTQYSTLLDWIEKGIKSKNNEDTEKNIFKLYMRDRFDSYSLIRSYFSQTDERLPALANIREENDVKIPIADWIFYCQTLPFHLETTAAKQRVLHPLTEYELVKLLNIIINCKDKQSHSNDSISKTFFNYLIAESHLFEIKMSPKQWTGFRNGEDIECTSDKDDSHNKENEKTQKIVESLFSLLTNRPWHTQIRKDFSMYKWNDLQSYFEMTYYPSTIVASLFVNHLNIHQDFYSRHYNMPLEELPYRDVNTRDNSNEILLWICNYLRSQADKQVYKTDNRKLELLEIDVDQLRGLNE